MARTRPRAPRCSSFLGERLTYVLEQRGYDVRNVRAVMAGRPVADISPLEARRMLEVLPEYTGTKSSSSWRRPSSA